MDLYRLFTRTKQLIHEQGWAKGSYTDSRFERVCLVHALDIAASEQLLVGTVNAYGRKFRVRPYYNASKHGYEPAPSPYELLSSELGTPAEYYNDAVVQDLSEIDAVLDRMAARYKQPEPSLVLEPLPEPVEKVVEERELALV